MRKFLAGLGFLLVLFVGVGLVSYGLWFLSYSEPTHFVLENNHRQSLGVHRPIRNVKAEVWIKEWSPENNDWVWIGQRDNGSIWLSYVTIDGLPLKGVPKYIEIETVDSRHRVFGKDWGKKEK